jgi:tartrate dehydrogenase/decarboxylase/D-malate dehydrogenase
MLDHLGETEAAEMVMKAIEKTTANGIGTRPGANGTDAITAAVISGLEQ